MDKYYSEMWSILLFWRSNFQSQNRLSKETPESTQKQNKTKQNKKKTVKTTYEWYLITNISNKYKIIERNKLYTVQKISERNSPNVEYENFVTAHMEE